MSETKPDLITAGSIYSYNGNQLINEYNYTLPIQIFCVGVGSGTSEGYRVFNFFPGVNLHNTYLSDSLTKLNHGVSRTHGIYLEKEPNAFKLLCTEKDFNNWPVDCLFAYLFYCIQDQVITSRITNQLNEMKELSLTEKRNEALKLIQQTRFLRKTGVR